jgi:hypothetical protein
MKRALLLPRLALALWFLLATSCATTGEAPPSESPRPPPKTVKTSELPGGRLRLSFEPVAPHPTLERLRVEEARAVLTDLHASLLPREESRLRLVRVSTGAAEGLPAEWEVRMRQEYLSRFGEALLPLPQSLIRTRPPRCPVAPGPPASRHSSNWRG